MKKRILPIFVFTLCLTFWTCKKKTKSPLTTTEILPTTTEMKSGLPSDPKMINGYLYAACHSDHDGVSMSNYVRAFAVFGDPARNLLLNYDHQTDQVVNNPSVTSQGNVQIGKVTFTGFALSSGASATGWNFTTAVLQNTFTFGTNWITEGNSSFKAINVLVSRGFPVITPPATIAPISISNGYQINFSGIISNFDSVSVRISNSPVSSAPGIQKKAVSGSSVVEFSNIDLAKVLTANTSGYIYLRAFNYSNKIVEDKVYLFELSNKHEQQVLIYP